MALSSNTNAPTVGPESGRLLRAGRLQSDLDWLHPEARSRAVHRPSRGVSPMFSNHAPVPLPAERHPSFGRGQLPFMPNGGIVGSDQKLFTARGLVTAEAAAAAGGALVVAYDDQLGRYVSTLCAVEFVGDGPVLDIATSIGSFTVAPTARFGLLNGRKIALGGQSWNLSLEEELYPLSVTRHSAGYPLIGLRDGSGRQELLHRLVAEDVMRFDVTGQVVHHVNADKSLNIPSNLEVFESQSDHARAHAEELVSSGTHQFLGHNRKKRSPKQRRASRTAACRPARQSKSCRRIQVMGVSQDESAQPRFGLFVPGTDKPVPVAIWPSGSSSPFGKGVVVASSAA